MSSRKPMRKPVRKPVRTPAKRKRSPVKKKKKVPFYDKVTMTNVETKEAKKFQKIAQEIITPLEQLLAKIESDIAAIRVAKKRVHFLRALRGTILSNPNLLWCPQKRHQVDLIVCSQLCKSPCTHYNNGRYICRMLRCNDEQIADCGIADKRCKTFYAYEPFIQKYVNAYSALQTVREKLSDIENFNPAKKKKFRRKK